MYQDVHCHFQDAKERQPAELICSAERAGVGRIFLNGTRPADWGIVTATARQFPQIVPFFGVHPWYVNELPALWMHDLRSALGAVRAGIGEIGLDKGPRAGDFERQKEVFAQQLDMAIEWKLPVIMHCVKAWDEMSAIIAQFPALKAIPVIFHSFMGPRDLAGQMSDMNTYFSFAPRLIAPENKKLRTVFAQLPADRILLESDYPYVPASMSGDDYGDIMRRVYCEAAAIRGTDETAFKQQVWDNGSTCTDALIAR